MPFLDERLIVLATLGASLILFVTDALRYDLVAVLVVLVLASTGCLEPSEAFAGFSSPAIILIASMYVFGHAMSRWGVAEKIGERLIGPARGEARLALRVALVAGLLSAVLSNTGVVASLIPIIALVARRADVPVSRLYIPLAFGSLLGGMLTVIGTSTNVAVNEAIRKANAAARDVGGAFHEPFSLFEFSHFGLLCLLIGCLYLWSPFRLLLPRHRVDTSLSEHYQVPRFVTEVLVEPASTLINRTVAESLLTERHGVSVLGIARPDEDSVLAPGPYNRIRGADTLILQGEPEAILRLREEFGLRTRKSARVGELRLDSADVQLVEAVVPAASEMVGRTLRDYDFRAQSGLNVLAISQHGDVQPSSMDELRLDVGDTLLLQGHAPDIERARRTRELLILGELESSSIGRGALITILTLLSVLLCTGLGWLPLSVSALAGAALLVLTGTVKPEEVRRTMDWPVLILIGGMLSLGEAFQRHGLGASLAHWIAGLGGGSTGDPYLLLILLLISTTALCQLINHVTAAVIMTPVALSFADELGLADRPFLMAVLVGANLCFLTPVAHQANAMVMGPGDYRYRDFLKVGTPLAVILIVVSALVLPWLWPFEG